MQNLYNLSVKKPKDQMRNHLSFYKKIKSGISKINNNKPLLIRYKEQRQFIFTVILFLGILSHPIHAQKKNQSVILKGKSGVEAIFEVSNTHGKWIGYRDIETGQKWEIGGPIFYLELPDGKRLSISEKKFKKIQKDSTAIVFEMNVISSPLKVRQSYSFSDDNRTLRIQTALRSTGKPVLIHRAGLLSISVKGEALRQMGPQHISFPVFGERIFAGVEHPTVETAIHSDSLDLSQSIYLNVGNEWIDLPTAVFGSASKRDVVMRGNESVRRAFIRYLDKIRVKPNDMHVNYNDWWTAPQPNSESFVLENIQKLKKNLYDRTGFFFDSYTIDEGWADPHSVWQINKINFPDGFSKVTNALESIGSQTGLWLSPSSLYPVSLENKWLQTNGYEVTTNGKLGLNACIAIGGRYQTAFKEALLKHTRNANLRHIKFDGFTPSCDDPTHNHPIGSESYLPIAEGLMDVFDALLEINPDIALEPTCFGPQPSPWWLMHVPFIIGPLGDDSPKGRSPSPDWIEAMTTARDIPNLKGRDGFLMPGSALQTFDIVVQSPGAFQNHAVMTIGRGRWFIASYINPAFMDAKEWQFFTDLISWARYNKEYLQNPIPIGGDPALRQAYGYAFQDKSRELFCLRNPWMEETFIDIPKSTVNKNPRVVRSMYPTRQILARIEADDSILRIHLAPYETKFIEIVAVDNRKIINEKPLYHRPEVSVSWNPDKEPLVTSTIFTSEPKPYGPNWSSPTGYTKEVRTFNFKGNIDVKGSKQMNLRILCEGLKIKSAFPDINLIIDGVPSKVEISRSIGSFYAGGFNKEDWVWFTTPLSEGRHHITLTVEAFTDSANFGVFLEGTVEALKSLPTFESGPSFPLYQPKLNHWSHAIVLPDKNIMSSPQPKPIPRKINYINGIYLDKMEWIEATTGWRTVQQNHSVKGETMTMGGKIFHRGIGTHAYSRIVYKRPEKYDILAATIGCDQKALVGSLVFVVEGDGKELFRSQIFRADSEPLEIKVPIKGFDKVVLIVEDGGDRVNADHGNWANARFIKMED